MKRIETAFEQFVFASRWIQAPLYGGLIIASVIYAYRFSVELLHLVSEARILSEEQVMLSVLSLVDITMVANLLAMVVIGGYATFVSKLDSIVQHQDRPDWLEKIDASTMKIKLAASLVGISGIHLLKSFLNVNEMNVEHIKWQTIIHVVFLLSGLMLAWTERILHPHVDHGNGKGHAHRGGHEDQAH